MRKTSHETTGATTAAPPVPILTHAELLNGSVGGYLPDYKTFDEVYTRDDYRGKTRIACIWLSGNLPADTQFHPQAGVNKRDAIRAIGAITRASIPYKHKMAAIAYFIDVWFKRIVFDGFEENEPATKESGKVDCTSYDVYCTIDP